MFNNFKDKTILITGHTGFKGAWLSIWLKTLGARVIGYALDPKTRKDIYLISGIADQITDYREDIRDREKLFEIIHQEKPEIVFHLAAQPLVIEGYSDPLYTYETNIMGTLNVLEAMRRFDFLKTGLFITSDKCYENSEQPKAYKETDRLGGFDPYSSSKAACELVIAAYRNSYFPGNDFYDHGKTIASVRAGNVIGGGDWSENRLIPDCVRALENNKEICIRNPEATRPWQHVLEPLGGYLLLADKILSNKAFLGEAYNFGPDQSSVKPVSEVVELVLSYYGKGKWKDCSEIKAHHEAKLLSLDITKAKSVIDWSPLWSIEEALRYTIDWYKNARSGNVYSLCLDQISLYSEKWKSKRVK